LDHVGRREHVQPIRRRAHKIRGREVWSSSPPITGTECPNIDRPLSFEKRLLESRAGNHHIYRDPGREAGCSSVHHDDDSSRPMAPSPHNAPEPVARLGKHLRVLGKGKVVSPVRAQCATFSTVTFE
jgi:hypothetical protein